MSDSQFSPDDPWPPSGVPAPGGGCTLDDIREVLETRHGANCWTHAPLGVTRPFGSSRWSLLRAEA